MMKIKNHSDDRIFTEAARWISDFHDGRADRSAFFAWLAESPRHVEELTLALALTHEIANLSKAQRDDIEAMASQATASTSSSKTTLPPNVVALHDSDVYDPVSMRAKSRSRHGKSIQRNGLLAAGIAAISLAGWWAFGSLSWHTYTTGVGEQRTLELEDGSLVTLNTNSRLKVRFKRTSRILQLVSGEALFKVHHDADRPFLVDAGDSVIRAVGTQFDVYRKAGGTTVSVLEGTVQVLPAASPMAALSSNLTKSSDARVVSAQATAGETVEVSQAGVTKHRQTSAAEVIAWQQRRLVFHDDTLRDIAAEFNRYNRAPKIQVEGDQAQQHRFAGTFDANAPDALVSALRSDETLAIEPGPDRIVIKSRN
jgi:transmembrane sensor